MRMLVDVDGVVADLMGGFQTYIKERFSRDLNKSLITTHNLALSPDHQGLHREIDLHRSLVEFLSIPTCYQDYILPIERSREMIQMIIDVLKVEVCFVTATLKQAPQSYASKFLWLEKHFPGIPVISCPSDKKHWVMGEFAVDDRFDICDRWSRSGVKSFVFRQPWNEAPPSIPRLDWEEIYDALVCEIKIREVRKG